MLPSVNFSLLHTLIEKIHHLFSMIHLTSMLLIFVIPQTGQWGGPLRRSQIMVTITLYARQQKRHRCIEQSFGLCGRGRGWEDLGEWHWNMYNIIYETNRQSRFNAGYRMLGAGALGWPGGMVRGGRWERGSAWGARIHPCFMLMYGKTNTIL